MLSRILRIGLLLAILAQIGWSFRPTPSGAQTDLEARGRALYEANCSTCHGLDAAGTTNGPSLVTVGPAAVDFMLRTGRMPLANPGDQPTRGEPRFSRDEIGALIAYVSALVPGGEPIPSVDPSRATSRSGTSSSSTAARGATAQVRLATRSGGGQIAPSIYPADATEIGEAVRIGPGVMPRFGPETIDQHELDSLAAYLLWLHDNGDQGGLQLGRVGAVAEGLVAVVVGLGILVLVLRLTGAKR